MKPPSLVFLWTMLFFSAATLAADSAPPVSAPPPLPPSQMESAQRARGFFESGNFDGAEKIYVTMLAAVSDNLYVLSNLGVARFRAGKLDLAADALRRATAIAPADAFSHQYLGLVASAKGWSKAAQEAFDTATALDPSLKTEPEHEDSLLPPGKNGLQRPNPTK